MNQLPVANCCCPYCANPFERLAEPDKHIEWAMGDLLICIRCAGVAMVSRTLHLREVTKYEMRGMRTIESVMFHELDLSRRKIREMGQCDARSARRAARRERVAA